MSLRLTDEQVALNESVDRILDRAGSTDLLREQRSKADLAGFSRALWRTFAESGIAGVLVPEEFGGAGLGMVEAGVVMSALGRTLAPLPFFSTSVLATRALIIAGSSQQKCTLLPAIASGRIVVSLAIDEASKHDPWNSFTAFESSNGYILNGSKSFVIDGQCADHLIVVTRVDRAPQSNDTIGLFIVDAKQTGVVIEPVRSLDSHVVARVEFRRCIVDAKCLLGERGNGCGLLEDLLNVGSVAIASELCGIANECFRRTLDYLKQRRQFGRIIGNFQALQHRAARLYAELEISGAAVLKAAQSLDADSPDCTVLASVAKARAGFTANLAAQESVQMHGGIGMTDAMDIGLFLKRARVAQELFGDANYHLERVAQLHGYGPRATE
jgi:alkylation response protein AidB-like acyl-CoA dehydrogenase